MTKRRKVITNNNYNQIPQQQQFSQYPQQYQPVNQQQPIPPHLQQTLNNQGQQPMGGHIRYPHLPYDANDVAQPVQQKPVQGHLQRIRQAKKGYNVPTPMPYQQVVADDDDYEGDEDTGAMQNQLFRYLQQEQHAKNGTAQMANMSALNYLQQIQAEAEEEDEERAPHNGYALAWISVNAILSFAANLFFATQTLGIHPIISVILAILFVFAPSLALWSARAMWRYIQKPGGWMKDGALITGFLLSLAPLGISWLATVVLLSNILVFELSLSLLVAYGAFAIATDLPQFVYFLRK